MLYKLFNKPLHLFFIGAAVHLVYVFIIFNSPQSSFYGLLRADRNDIKEKISNIQDAKEYVLSAENYSTYKVFGNGTAPDYHRTIGYPMIIYALKCLAGSYWFVALILLQAVLGALIYPLLYLIGKILITDSPVILAAGMICLFVTGSFCVRTVFVLTEVFFCLFLFAGLYLSLLAVIKKHWLFLAAAVILISFSALIRPTMMFYAVIHLLLLAAIARKYEVWKYRGTKVAIGLSTFFLVFSCNISSFRTYNCYSTFSPSDILGINMMDYSAKYILEKNKEGDQYTEWNKNILTQTDFIEKDKLRKQYFYETVKAHPVTAMRYWTQTMFSHMLTPHWIATAYVYGFYKRDVPLHGLRRSKSVSMMYYLFFIVNFILLIIPAGVFFVQMIRKGELLLAAAILIYCAYFICPSLLAQTSERFRLPLEPFIVLMAFSQISIWYSRIRLVIAPRVVENLS